MLLDIGVGIMLALFVGKIFALQPSAFFILAGIVFSLLMDTDALINLLVHRGTAQSYRHRDLLHIPLLYIPIGMLAIFLYPFPLAPALSVLFGLCSLCHLIHDSIGLGWGIKWLSPWSDDHYSFLYQYNARKAGLRPGRFGIYVWKEKDIEELEKNYGDATWFRTIYLGMHPYCLTEIGVFLFSLIVLRLVLKN